MKKGLVIIISVVLVLVALAGSAYVLAPKVNVDIEVSDDGTTYIVVENPTPFTYRLESFEAKLLMGNYEIGSVSLPNPVTVGPGQEVRVPATVNVNVGNALIAALAGVQTVEATVYYKITPTIGPISLPAYEASEHETVS